MKGFILVVGLLAVAPRAQAVEVKGPDQLIAQVKGIVCSFCAYGAEKNLSRVGFLDKSRFSDGVLLDIKKGLITLALDLAKPIDLRIMMKAVEYGGYDLVAVHLNLRGRIEKREGAAVLVSESSGQAFELLDPKGNGWEPGKLLGKAASIQALVPVSRIGNRNDSRVVVEVKSAAEAAPSAGKEQQQSEGAER